MQSEISSCFSRSDAASVRYVPATQSVQESSVAADHLPAAHMIHVTPSVSSPSPARHAEVALDVVQRNTRQRLSASAMTREKDEDLMRGVKL